MIRQYKIGASGGVFLVDSAGDIKLHRDQAKRGASLSDREGLNANALLNKARVLLQRVKDGQGDTIVTAKYLPQLGWYVVAELLAKEVNRNVQTINSLVSQTFDVAQAAAQASINVADQGANLKKITAFFRLKD